MVKLERDFQPEVVKRIKNEFPGCIIVKNDANYKQGIPDLLILFRDKWAALEVKKTEPGPSDYRPNQEWYIELLNEMSYASVIYPENFERVIDDLRRALRP